MKTYEMKNITFWIDRKKNKSTQDRKTEKHKTEKTDEQKKRRSYE